MGSSDKLKKTKSDHSMSALKAALSLLPAGSAVASLIDDYIPTSLEKRHTALLIQLHKDIEALEGKFDKEVLTREYFITTFIEAFRNARATHDKEKIEAFRAIILNTLISQEPHEDEAAVMLSLTGRLSPLHIKLLKIFEEPSKALEHNPEAKARFENISMGSLQTLTSALLPRYQPDLVKTAVEDLINSGLLNISSFGGTMTKSGVVARRLSHFGQDYIEFITLPKEIENNKSS